MLEVLKKVLISLLMVYFVVNPLQAAKVKGVANIEVPYSCTAPCGEYPIQKENEITFIYTTPEKKQEVYAKIPIFPNGNVIVPMIGETVAAGKTTGELRQYIEEKLGKDYVVNLFVYREADNVSVLGEVRNPGSYSHNNIRTVYDAITKAGGFTQVAKKVDVQLIRQRSDGTRVLYSINFPKEVFQAYEPGSGVGEAVYNLREGDLVFVPTSRWKQLGQFGLKAVNLATLGILTGVFTGIISSALN